jgi:hypothetical protein
MKAEVAVALYCECGSCMCFARDEEAVKYKRYAACPNPDCKTFGQRYSLPALELTPYETPQVPLT